MSRVKPLNRKFRVVFRILSLFAAAGCSAAQTPSANDPNALTVVAEIALERGDCRTASETYSAAALRGAVAVAKRASEVALACEHLPAAWESVKRWRALAPDNRDAALIYATVALKLYRIPEARAGVAAVMQAAGKDADTKLAELTSLLLDEADPPAVLAAVGGALEPSTASPAVLALLAELSLDAYDVKRAEQFARLALKRDPKSFEAKHIIARAYVMKGDAANAVETARDLMRSDAPRGAFELADVFAGLDRVDEARRELERLRATGTALGEVERRLAVLAFQSGDFEEAQRRFAELAAGGEASDAAVLYLADIAARDGDTETALAGYRRLINSSLAVAARARAAALLMDKKNRDEALMLLDDYIADHPERSFEVTITKAHLLSEHGESAAGLALLAASLQQHPGHPALEYDRAVLLEHAGSVRESVATLEKLLAQRSEDPTLLNALGYTLADHGLDLTRAEGLIRRALGAMPDNPAVLDSLGWVRFKRGDSRDAVSMLGRAYGLAHDPDIAAHWGEALWQSGSHQEARRVWAAALARDPDSTLLKATLTRFVSAEKP